MQKAVVSRRIRLTKYLPEFVYGGIDGLVTTFAVVAWATWANLDLSVVLILWFANLFADGFSMSVWAYLASKSEYDSALEHHRVQSSHKEPFFVGLSTLLSFVLIWLIPLGTYVVSFLYDLDPASLFEISVALTAAGFVGIGLMKSYINRTNRRKAMAETVILGGLAASVAYYVWFILEKIIVS